MDDYQLNAVLRCLSDATRRVLLDRLRDVPGQTLSQLTDGLPQSRQALSKHLALLEDAALVVPVWRGREKLHYLNPEPLEALPARWVTTNAREGRRAREALAVALGHGAPQTNAARRVVARDPLALALAADPSPLLRGQLVLSAEALAAAVDYLQQTAQAMQALLQAMAPREGYAKPDDGGFSLVEHVWHLADIETLGWRVRFERILVEPRPRLPGVDGDRLAREQRYQERPWRAAAQRFVVQRRHSLAALARFDESVLQRTVHFSGARTSAGGVVAAAVAHDLDHRPAMAALWSAQPLSAR